MSEEPVDWIAWRLAVLLTDPSGVAHGNAWTDRAVRLGLVVDLVLRGRLVDRDGGWQADTSPTGFRPADVLSCYIDGRAEQTLLGVVANGPVRHLDVLDPTRLGLTGRGGRKPLRIDPRTVGLELRIVDETADSGAAESVDEAAVAALAGALNVVVRGRRLQLLAQCGVHAEFLADCCRYLDDIGLKFALISTHPGGGGG